MNIQVIAEHSVDLDLLPDKAHILDAGCRGFEFTNHFRECGHNVRALDIASLRGVYTRKALVSVPGWYIVHKTDDPQATHISSKTINSPGSIYGMTVSDLEMEIGCKFDLIKLDIEGEEYEILKTSQHPLAKQISVEFHAHTGRQSKDSLDNLLDYLSEFYTIHNRVWEERHQAGFNYWDVLLIAK